MEEERKLSIKRVDISLNNFNDIAIPHHIDLLKKHKANIIKYQNVGDMNRIKNEQINATRIVVQLRHLLEEMDTLRQQVREVDLAKFDMMTEKSRNITFKAIKEYIDLTQSSENQPSPSFSSGYSSHSPVHDHDRKDIFQYPSAGENLTLQVDDSELLEEQCREEESYLRSWEKLQDEVQDLHEIFVKFHEVTNSQKHNVKAVEENVEIANANVEQGTSILARASQLKTVWYPFTGALLGGCIAGPLGLAAGLKMGGFALLSGTALGFTGGRILKNKVEMESDVSTHIKEDLGEVSKSKDD